MYAQLEAYQLLQIHPLQQRLLLNGQLNLLVSSGYVYVYMCTTALGLLESSATIYTLYIHTIMHARHCQKYCMPFYGSTT